MAYHTETRTFTMEIEVTATATIETGGGFSDEPAWAMMEDANIDSVTYDGISVVMERGSGIYRACIQAATEEFAE